MRQKILELFRKLIRQNVNVEIEMEPNYTGRVIYFQHSYDLLDFLKSNPMVRTHLIDIRFELGIDISYFTFYNPEMYPILNELTSFEKPIEIIMNIWNTYPEILRRTVLSKEINDILWELVNDVIEKYSDLRDKFYSEDYKLKNSPLDPSRLWSYYFDMFSLPMDWSCLIDLLIVGGRTIVYTGSNHSPNYILTLQRLGFVEIPNLQIGEYP